MRYLDANVFLYAALYEGPKANRAVDILRELHDGAAPAVTSMLTIDEIAWKTQRLATRDAALAEAGSILRLPNLRLLPATAETMREAVLLMEQVPHLKPRDAVHAATAFAAGIFTIISDDKDFDKVPGLRREPLV